MEMGQLFENRDCSSKPLGCFEDQVPSILKSQVMTILFLTFRVGTFAMKIFTYDLNLCFY
ncbi:hypothetical protein MtrunA17_Chr3g0102381 [Medicago truncatula]|uniref:Uncharacterized protein n=1 Tax=Medicago truncatula TaxID=3880 RepID=A0A396ISQ3_MEDTR|nr:hypothetical protein MtrunA17_Chr3g0102381 [Medicago truncatula]